MRLNGSTAFHLVLVLLVLGALGTSISEITHRDDGKISALQASEEGALKQARNSIELRMPGLRWVADKLAGSLASDATSPAFAQGDQSDERAVKLFDRLFQQFADELSQRDLHAAIGFATGDGQLLVVRRRRPAPGSGLADDFECELFLRAGKSEKRWAYLAYPVPPTGRTGVVSEYLASLPDALPAASRPFQSKAKDLVQITWIDEHSPLAVWTNGRPVYDVTEIRRGLGYIDKDDHDPRFYRLDQLAWFKQAMASDRESIYGVIEDPEGIEHPPAALRKVTVQGSGVSVEGVLFVALTDLDPAETSPGSAYSNDPTRRPFATIFLASNLQEKTGDDPPEPTPEVGSSPAPRPVIPKPSRLTTIEYGVAAQERGIDKRTLGKEIALKASALSPFAAQPQWPDTPLEEGGAVAWRSRVFPVGGEVADQKWQIAMLFEKPPVNLGILIDRPLATMNLAASVPLYAVPVVGISATLWLFFLLWHNRVCLSRTTAALKIQEAALEAEQAALKAQSQALQTGQEAIEEIRKEIGATMHNIAEKYASGYQALDSRREAERGRASELEKKHLSLERYMRRRDSWLIQLFASFRHDVAHQVAAGRTPAALGEFVKGEVGVAQALVSSDGRSLPAPSILTREIVRDWFNDADQGKFRLHCSNFSVMTQPHVIQRIMRELVHNAREAAPSHQVNCWVTLRPAIRSAETPPPPQPEDSSAVEPAPATRADEPVPPTLPPVAELPPALRKPGFLARLGGLFKRNPAPTNVPTPLANPVSEPVPEAAVPSEERVAGEPEEPILLDALELVVTVANHAPSLRPLAAKGLENLFDRDRTKRDSAIAARGMGLPLARMLARLAKGNLIVFDGKDDEIVFELAVPAFEPPAGLSKPEAQVGTRPLLVLDDDSRWLVEVEQNLATDFRVSTTAEPMVCYQKGVEKEGPEVMLLDYDLGLAETAEFPDGLAVARALRTSGYHGLIVFYTGAELSDEVKASLTEVHAWHLLKGNAADLPDHLSDIEIAWTLDETPAWRAEEFANLFQAAASGSVRLRPLDVSRIGGLVSDWIRDPVLRSQLLSSCEKKDGTMISTILRRFISTPL